MERSTDVKEEGIKGEMWMSHKTKMTKASP